MNIVDLGGEPPSASYLLDTDDGPALVDCGPASSIDVLEAGLAQHGVPLAELRHLLLTHVHPRHAGAAALLVRRQPALQVHADVRVLGERVLGLECVPTPGHTADHVSYLDRDGTLYAGDAAGARISPGRFVVPSTPPGFDLDAWQASLEQIELCDPERLALTHHGVYDDVQRHLADLRLELYEWTDTIRGGASEEEFVEYVRVELRDAGERLAMPLEQSYQGLKRWADSL